MAEVLWRDVLESTDGPIEHVSLRCAQRHVFFMPTAKLSRGPGVAPAVHPQSDPAPTADALDLPD